MHERDKAQLRAHTAEELGLAGSHKVSLVVLPQTKGGMEVVTHSRRELLAASIRETFSARTDRSKQAEPPTRLDETSILEVCGTCRGSCCKWGEDHAYLDRALLSRVKREQKLTNDALVLEAYIDRVPKLARVDSCIFHGAEGCTLPRSMRSDTCNRYLCYPLKQLGQDFARPGYAQLAVSEDDEAEDRVLLLSDGKTRRLRALEADDDLDPTRG